ncbi:MAG: hypothetical protein LBH74_09105 [Nitrososphaerota archaeon]|jgi:hypothetical protein|nr:hypothetical protein [Nitrososphaerota archaeon]
MEKTVLRLVCLLVVLTTVLSLMPISGIQGQAVQDYTSSFLLFNCPDGDQTYELNLTIPQNIYQYYTMKSHSVFSTNAFSKFVTPNVFKPVADTLWQLYDNTEDFTNGVLTLVHQITYEETIPSRYPVETLVIGKGDCDLFVYIAASILEAGGIHTVLLFYEEKSHMQLGVDLGNSPSDVRDEVFYITYQNVPYYIAECTGSAWRRGWRVGECPSDYQNITVQVIPLDYIEQTSIGQASVSIRELDSSVVTLKVSSALMIQNTEISISGQILPITADENVTIRAQTSGGWMTIATVPTQQDGRFNYNWTPPAVGPIKLQASWAGNHQNNGASSDSQGIVVLPLYFVAVIITSAVALTTMFVTFIKLRHRKPQLLPVADELESQIMENTNFTTENYTDIAQLSESTGFENSQDAHGDFENSQDTRGDLENTEEPPD